MTSCTAGGKCDSAGTCVAYLKPAGKPWQSDDGCTTLICDANGAVAQAASPTGTACGDGCDPCVKQACDGKGCCTGTPAVGKSCLPSVVDDCHTTGACDATGACQPIVATGNSCKLAYPDACKETGKCSVTGACVAVPEAKGKPVASDSVCIVATCDGEGGKELNIPVGKVCGPPAGVCQPRVCTANGVCKLQVTAGIACKDGNPCHAPGVCDDSGKCVTTLVPGAACPTGDPCLKGTCDAVGHCSVATAVGAVCKNDCTTSGSGICDAKAHCIGQGIPGKACYGCAWGTCDGSGLCVPKLIGSPCTKSASCSTVGVCLADGVCNTVNVADGTPCALTQSCVETAVCMNGSCLLGQGHNQFCDDAFVCTTDSCGMDGNCQHWNSGQGCSDDACPKVCKDDYTGTVVCGYSGGWSNCNNVAWCLENCNDGNPCTTDECDSTGGCYHQLYDGGCCGGGKVCQQGKCVVKIATSAGTCGP